MTFFRKRKARKHLKAVLHHARTFRASREDLLAQAELAEIDAELAKAQEAYRAGGLPELEQAAEALDACVARLNPPKPLAFLRENFDVLVVAISVAMAFRAYFYQPFKIPTGSMQPTLYGIHIEPRPPSAAGLLDRQPFKFAKWLVTGESFKVIRARARGEVKIVGVGNSDKPGYTTVVVGGYPHLVPNDAVVREGMSVMLKGGARHGATVRAGDVLWSGVVISGDFVFVNRWKWNFCHPKRGEVMVFSTTGIRALPQGTHYIKRMMGLPTETLKIRPPELLVNGTPVAEPERVRQIARRERLAPWAPPYAGFNPGGERQHALSIISAEDEVALGPDQYYAMGDNSFNSADSRYWGPVPERNLLGPATVVYWPLKSPRWGRIR